MRPLEYAPPCLRDKAVVRIRTDIRTRLNYMKPRPLTGIHAMTGRPLRRNSSHWCHRPLLPLLAIQVSLGHEPQSPGVVVQHTCYAAPAAMRVVSSNSVGRVCSAWRGRRCVICRHLQILLIGLAAHHASIAAAPHRESGFLDRAVAVGGVEYRYEVYVPRDYDPRRAWPIVLALHGGGEYGSDGIRPTVGALAKAIRLHPDRFPAIVVFAQAHADGTPGWQLKSGEAALVEVDE